MVWRGGGGTWKGASKRQFKSLTLSHLTYVRHAWSETDNAPMVGESFSYDRNMPAVSFFFCLVTKSSRSLLSRTGFVGRPDRLFHLGRNNFNTHTERCEWNLFSVSLAVSPEPGSREVVAWPSTDHENEVC